VLSNVKPIENAVGLPPRRAAASANPKSSKLDIFQNAKVAKETRCLKCAGKAGAADLMRRPPRHVVGIERDGAAVGTLKTAYHVDESCFPGTVGSDKAKDFAAAQLHVYAIEGGYAPET
jgi:hypothetical protein